MDQEQLAGSFNFPGFYSIEFVITQIGFAIKQVAKSYSETLHGYKEYLFDKIACNVVAIRFIQFMVELLSGHDVTPSINANWHFVAHELVTERILRFEVQQTIQLFTSKIN